MQLRTSQALSLGTEEKEKADANSTERFGGEAVNSNQVAGKVLKERFHLNQNKP